MMGECVVERAFLCMPTRVAIRVPHIGIERDHSNVRNHDILYTTASKCDLNSMPTKTVNAHIYFLHWNMSSYYLVLCLACSISIGE